MLKLKLFSLLVLILAITGCYQNSDDLQPLETFEGNVSLRESHDLCFASYNIHGFCQVGPGTTLTPSDLQDICDGLTNMDSDIINLQEVWCEEFKDFLVDCLGDSGYDNFVYDSESGLMTLSKTTLQRSQTIHFKGKEYGTDRFKNKGFTSTFIELEEGCEFNIINTHLQADGGFWDDALETIWPFFWGGPSESEIREDQLEQIETFVDQVDDCIPSIIGGDFNIDTDSDEFENIVDILPGKPTFILSGDTRVPPTSHGGTTLDYFFLSNFSSYYSDLSNQTITGDCIESYIIQRFNLIELDLESEMDAYPIVIGTYNTMAEAQEALITERNGNSGPFGTHHYYIQTENITVCTSTFENPSDHNPIETCFTYDCAEQEDCEDPPVINDPNEFGDDCIKNNHCPPGERCLNGHCVPY